VSFLSPSLPLRSFVVAAFAVVACGCGDSDSSPPRFAVLSAFPAEIAPNLARATISETIIQDGHVFHVGVLQGVPVILALTGIGLVNAAATTDALLARFDVTGVVVSAVAGSGGSLPIADVAVPAAWETTDGTSYPAHQEWLDLANEIAASGAVSLQRCTLVPSASSDPVCMPQQPTIVVGGVGQSSDPFNNKPFPCTPGGGDVYGCDPLLGTGATPALGRNAIGTLAAVHSAAPTAADAPVVVDMETAAIAREATAHGVPFIAFRAVSDGPGDPLGLPNFLEQFPAYYGLAAQNASAATIAFLEKVAQ
jgi:nucleoside phosphorylase